MSMRRTGQSELDAQFAFGRPVTNGLEVLISYLVLGILALCPSMSIRALAWIWVMVGTYILP